MSLEDRIAELDQRMLTLTSAIVGLTNVLMREGEISPAEPAKPPKPPKATPAKAPEAPPQKAQAAAVARAVAGAEAAADLDYKRDVAPMVLQVMSEVSREEATSILQRMGVVRASELPPNAWPELINLCKASLAGASAKDAQLEDEGDIV